MRTIKKQNKKITQLLLEKKELIEKGRALTAEIEEKEKERNKIALQVQKIKNKIMPFARNIKKSELEKYEDIQSIDIDGEDIVLTVFDYVEEYKKLLDEKIKTGKL